MAAVAVCSVRATTMASLKRHAVAAVLPLLLLALALLPGAAHAQVPAKSKCTASALSRLPARVAADRARSGGAPCGEAIGVGARRSIPVCRLLRRGGVVAGGDDPLADGRERDGAQMRGRLPPRLQQYGARHADRRSPRAPTGCPAVRNLAPAVERAGNIYFGMRQGSTCFCATTLAAIANGAVLTDSSCAYACVGDATEKRCGYSATTRISVYDLASSAGSSIAPPTWPSVGSLCALDAATMQNVSAAYLTQLVSWTHSARTHA